MEGKGEKEKERERNINVWLPLMCPLLETWPATQTCALTGLHQPGLIMVLFTKQTEKNCTCFIIRN